MKKLHLVFLIWAATIALLAGCASATSLPTQQTPSPAAEQASQPTATSAPLEPTATAAPPRVILAGSTDSDLQAKLAEFAAGSGLTLETHEALARENLTPDVKVVVLAAEPENLNDLLAAAPQAQFVVFAYGDLAPAANLTVIGQDPARQAFTAGFIAVLLSPDYRAGGLLPSDSPAGAALADAFINGGRYFCGVCASGYPYNGYYPLASAIPAASDAPSWLASAADLLDNQKVQVFYLSSPAARGEVYDYLMGKSQLDRPVLLIGAQPGPETLRSQWAATVTFDPAAALAQVWADVAAGKGGQRIEVPVQVKDVNDALLAPGRMRLVEEMLAELQAGQIIPATIPQE